MQNESKIIQNSSLVLVLKYGNDECSTLLLMLHSHICETGLKLHIFCQYHKQMIKLKNPDWSVLSFQDHVGALRLGNLSLLVNMVNL